MSTITALGSGTSYDYESLVKSLVANERAPADARLDDAEDKTTSRITAYGEVKAALSGLRDTLTKLLANGSAMGRLATPAAGAGFTATATTSAAMGKYQVTVEALASNHKLQTNAMASSAQLGYGNLSIKVGTDAPINVTIPSGKGTLADIRDAINTAAAGKGVTASVVKGDAGDVLMLTSNKTGTDGRMTVTSSGGDGGLAALNTTGGAWNVVDAGNNASVVVDGVRKSFSSNNVDMIDGLTLNLTKADPLTSFTLDVTADTSTLKVNMLGFVSAYNTAISKFAALSKSDGRKGAVSGPLSGDAAVRNLMKTMRSAVSTNYKALSELGLKTAVDGTLSLDGAKFDAAMNANSEATKALIGTDGPLGQSLRGIITNNIGADGIVTVKSNALLKKAESIDDQRDDLDLKMERVEERYRKQFSALSQIVAKMDGLSSYITNHLDSLISPKKS